jgi:hypothetical protein
MDSFPPDPTPEPEQAPPAGGPAVATAEVRRVLYRCKTPTNYLCPCGAAARRLKKRGLDYETQRVPFKKSDRPEIVELTKQNRVPVLVDGDEVIHDSKRILEYVDWRYTMNSDD